MLTNAALAAGAQMQRKIHFNVMVMILRLKVQRCGCWIGVE